MKRIFVEPNIHDDNTLQFLNSGRHYCTFGVSREYCFGAARQMAALRMNANLMENRDKWPVIDIAIVPHPDRPGLFILEDRSKKISFLGS